MAADTRNAETIQGYIDAIEKAPAPKPGTKPATPTKSTGKTQVPAAGSTKTIKTTKTGKPAVVKR
jgi:hypothetical protein